MQGEPLPDFTASDVLSSKLWQPRAERPPLGVDLACTKIAVDFQNITAGNADSVIRQSLDILREATGTDAVFLALLDGRGETIDSIATAKGPFAQCRPEVLKGEPLDALPWIRSRLEHVRILEIRDTVSARAEQAGDAGRLAALDIRSLLLIAFAVQGTVRGFLAFVSSTPRDGWDVNLHLLLKLVGTSLACGLEKVSLADRLADMQERQEMALPCANDGLWDYDAQTNHTWFSPRWKGMLGFAEGDVITSPDWHRMVHPEDLARVSAAMRDHIAGKTPMFESVHRLKHTDGEWRWVIGRACARVDDQGRLRRLIGVELDITERKLYEEALFREKESAQITLQSIGDGVITCDAHGRVEYLNPVAEELTGWRLEDSLGRTIDEIFRAFHEETCEPLENPLAVAVRRIRSIKSVRPMLLIRKDGNELYIESTASPIRDGTGTVTGGVLVFHDVSESRELNRRLSYHASHDVLTGLVNRREFETRLERALKSAKARETSYALCYIDLDQFKIVNDTCGHPAGDQLLRQVTGLLQTRVRANDVLARLGGDEFGVLLEHCTPDQALRIADSLRQAIHDLRFQWGTNTMQIGASIGIVEIDQRTESVAMLLSAADIACYSAKDGGRNRVQVYDPASASARHREMRWMARLTNARDEGRLDIMFQPIVRIAETSKARPHYELLLRLLDENGKIVLPDEFIPAAERFNLMPSLDRWVIEKVLRDYVPSTRDGIEEPAFTVAVNLSGTTLSDPGFLEFLIDALEAHEPTPGVLCFEVTETAAITNLGHASYLMREMASRGCLIALDDFGSGLSSFNYLRTLPVNYLKIDGNFVQNVASDPIDRSMVEAIVQIGRAIGIETVAERVETPAVLDTLRRIGVGYAQGFLCGRPAPMAAFPHRKSPGPSP